MLPVDLAARVRGTEFHEWIARAFERHGAEPPPGPLRVDYVRFKPGTSCLLGFGHGGTDTGSGLGYLKVFLSGDPEECFRKYRAREKHDGWVALLPELRAVFFRFPLDRHVIGLPSLAEPSRLKHVLHDAVPDLSPEIERVRARKSRVEVLKYKPERRCIVRADLGTKRADTGEKAQRRIVAQAYGDETGPRVFQLMKHLDDLTAGRGGTLRVPRPLGWHPERRVLVQEWRPGEPWGLCLGRPEEAVGCVEAADALRSLHELELPAGLPVDAPGRTTTEAVRVLEDLTRVGDDDLARLADGVRRQVLRESAESPDGTPTIVHGDFHYHQLLVGRDGPTLIDWDEARGGDPRVDVGNLLAHLHLLDLEQRISSERAASLGNLFLGTYLAGRPVPPAVDFFTSLQLVKLALTPFRNLRRDWRGEARAILERARRLLRTGREVGA